MSFSGFYTHFCAHVSQGAYMAWYTCGCQFTRLVGPGVSRESVSTYHITVRTMESWMYYSFAYCSFAKNLGIWTQVFFPLTHLPYRDYYIWICSYCISWRVSLHPTYCMTLAGYLTILFQYFAPCINTLIRRPVQWDNARLPHLCWGQVNTFLGVNLPLLQGLLYWIKLWLCLGLAKYCILSFTKQICHLILCQNKKYSQF